MSGQRKRAVKEHVSKVPPVAAGILSLIIPGAGQMASGLIRKGLLILASFVTIVGLLWWRLTIIGHPVSEYPDVIFKAFSRAPFFLLITVLLTLGLWAWTVVDAVRQARGIRKGGNLLFIPILVLFFAVGWQISEIDLVKMAVNFPQTLNPLSKILWPWEAAIEYETSTVSASAEVMVNSTDSPPPPAPEAPGKPYLVVDPPYGRMSSQDEQGNNVAGDTVKLTGRGFAPNMETEIWWRDSMRNEYRPRQAGRFVSVKTDGEGNFTFDLVLPYRQNIPNADKPQINHVEARQVSVGTGFHASEPLRITISLIIETIFMGMMATVFGILFSIPISFLSARNLMSGSRVSIAVYYFTRTILNIVRAIEPLIWALIAVVWVGLGPFAGILALTIHTVASLAKLYSEAIENIDHGQIEAVQATGATKLQTIFYAVIPQMIPPFVSFTIYRWDINVRMSTVIGMVGGGGIGFILVQYIRLLDYRAAGIAVWFIAVTVAVLDYVSAEIRNRFV